MGFFSKIAEWVSDIIPNEITKTNSITQWIPGVNVFTRGLSALDNWGETYSNTGDWGASLMHAGKGAMGISSDPFAYSPKNQGFSNDWWLNAGQIGNIFNPLKSGIDTEAWTKTGVNAFQTILPSLTNQQMQPIQPIQFPEFKQYQPMSYNQPMYWPSGNVGSGTPMQLNRSYYNPEISYAPQSVEGRESRSTASFRGIYG